MAADDTYFDFGFVVEAKGITPPLVRQTHGTEIATVNSAESWKNLRLNPPAADGVITFQKQLPVYAFSADCLPLLFYSTDADGPVAAVHSGWRGARSGIAAHALTKFECRPAELHVILGPCLLSCCFEVKQDFIDDFTRHGQNCRPFLLPKSGAQFFDLPGFVIKSSLFSLPSSHIHTEHLRCTSCSIPQLPSFRRDRITNPSIRAWIKKR
jgi:YfiH family protein